MRASYFVAVHTGRNYSPAEYNLAAQQLSDLMNSVLKPIETANTLFKGSVNRLHTEIEVSLEQYDAGAWEPGDGGWELALKAVIDVEGTGQLLLDKRKLSTLLRTSELNQWGTALKIEKKAVPKDVQAVRELTEDLLQLSETSPKHDGAPDGTNDTPVSENSSH